MMAEITIQKTRKRIKVQQPFALATLALGAGLCVMAAQSDKSTAENMMMANGILTTLGGVVWLGGLRIARWWFHD
jgi:hypothetical protein